jgi:hypothetical protein
VPQRALEMAAQRGKAELEGWRVRKDGCLTRPPLARAQVRTLARRQSGSSVIKPPR